MTTSAVDVTFPPDIEKVSKAEMRAQFLVIKNELNSLFARVGVAGAMAFAATTSDVEQMLFDNNTKTRVSFARDVAFGRVSL